MHYKIGIACLFNDIRYIRDVVITRHSNPPISKFSEPFKELTSVWSMFLCTSTSYIPVNMFTMMSF